MRRISLAVLALLLLLCPLALADKNPDEYPLHIRILEVHWQRTRFGNLSGWGRGNLWSGQNVRGFDFTFVDNQHFMRTVGSAHYLGKWKKEPVKLEMLVGEIGAVDKYYAFELKTAMRPDIYVGGSGGLTAISPEEFDRRRKRAAGNAGAQPGE